MPTDKRGDISLPFFHLSNEDFWHLIPRSGKEAVITTSLRLRSISELNEFAIGAKLDDELFTYLSDLESRDVLRTVLIETYFAPEVRSTLLEQGKINNEAFRYSQKLLEQVAKENDIPPLNEKVKIAIRNQGFRRAIVTAYEHRCTTCGLRILTAERHTVVEAAHIIPFSISFNDNPRNGLSLCRLCHWSFDEGMLSISGRYEVLTSPQLTDYNNLPSYVVTLTGRRIIHPIEERFMPDLDALEWHRKNVFRNR